MGPLGHSSRKGHARIPAFSRSIERGPFVLSGALSEAVFGSHRRFLVRDNEMPPMRDRQTMVRRVRGYVTQSKTGSHTSASVPVRATNAERKALATMGRKGGQRAAERWKTDPNGEYAQAQRDTMGKTHRRNRVHPKATVRPRHNVSVFPGVFS